MDTIIVVNRSTVLTDEQVRNVIPALQDQVSRDFEPVWGIGATIVFAADLGPNDWPLYILDTTDVPGAGGYHLDANGKVEGKVFARDAMEAGEAWTVDLSHELLEMLADPSAGTDPSKFIALTGKWEGYKCLREVCDAVEDDSLGYGLPGADKRLVLLSDFVTPAYFEDGAVSNRFGQADFKGHLPTGAVAPALLQGGYLGLLQPDGTWTQVSDFALAPRSRAHRSKRRSLWGISQK